MKVCMLVHNPPFQGGIVQYCVLLANALKKEDLNLSCVGFKKLYPPILYKGKQPKSNKSGIQFKTPIYNSIIWYNPLSWIFAYKKIKNSDIFHFHWVSPLLTPLYYTILKLNQLFAKKKVVVTCHNIEPHESTFLDKIFTKIIFSKIDHFIVHAKQNKTRLEKDYKIERDNIHIIPHGTFDFFTKWKKESKTELKKEFGLENKKVILFFGYIREYKGLRYLIRALNEVVKKEPDIRLIIAGELWQKWKTYQKEIDKNKLNKYIKVYSNYILDEDVHKFFNLADIVVLPYYNTEQTISGPLLVSFAFGKPTIISKVGGISEIVKDDLNGILVQGGNVKELSTKILKLINNRIKQRNLGKSVKRFNNMHKWGNIAKATINTYKKMLK